MIRLKVWGVWIIKKTHLPTLEMILPQKQT